MEQEEAERNMQILLDFLHCLRKQKVEELNEVYCWPVLDTDEYCFFTYKKLEKYCCCLLAYGNLMCIRCVGPFAMEVIEE